MTSPTLLPMQTSLTKQGFLPADDPVIALDTNDAWQTFATHLPQYLVGDNLRAQVEALPTFSFDAIDTEYELHAAMRLLSFVGHAYVWGYSEVSDRLPANLATAWHSVAERLGRPPVLSYESYALDNWYRLDRNRPIELGNIALIQNFWGGVDEQWFILVHVEIEAKAAPLLLAFEKGLTAREANDIEGLRAVLNKMAAALESICDSLDRMPEFCDPYIYYHRVRPYIHGWKDNPALPNGLLYDGVQDYQGVPQQFRGETGAQSGIVPCCDAFFGVAHEDDPLRVYLQEMRDYMPPAHRAFLEALEAQSSIRAFVRAADDSMLKAAYNECIDHLVRFRLTHLRYAADYIHRQSETSKANPTQTGTGGTPFMTYLKKHEEESLAHRLD